MNVGRGRGIDTRGTLAVSAWGDQVTVQAGAHTIVASSAMFGLRVAAESVTVEVRRGVVLVDGAEVTRRWPVGAAAVEFEEPSVRSAGIAAASSRALAMTDGVDVRLGGAVITAVEPGAANRSASATATNDSPLKDAARTAAQEGAVSARPTTVGSSAPRAGGNELMGKLATASNKAMSRQPTRAAELPAVGTCDSAPAASAPTPDIISPGFAPGDSRSGVGPLGSALGDEAALLEKSEYELRTLRDPAAALGTLERSATKFPNGSLQQEVALTKLEALRQLGRWRELASVADAFARRYPGSERLDEVRALSAFAAKQP